MFTRKQFIVYDRGTKIPYGIDKPLTYADAQAAASKDPRFGVGFKFTADDPYFFLDLDGCLQADNTWSPVAIDLCGRFPGAYVEVSLSGRGLHIIGSSPVPVDHSCKNASEHIELYTEGRYAALTGTNAQGDANTEHTAALAATVAQYFPPREVTPDTEWTDGPCAGSNPIANDLDLIGKMIKSKSGAAVFGTRASVSSLWEGSDDLGQWYPDPQGLRAYDASTADAALCQHLAFWTGKDCERMDRLFRMSGLYREKWEDREDYRLATITGACGLCTKTYGERERPPGAPAGEPTVAVPPVGERGPSVPMAAGEYRTGYQMMTGLMQQEHFKGCVYIRDNHRILTPDGSLLKPDQFRAVYGGYMFSMDAEGNKQTDNAWKAFSESRAVTFGKAHSTCFRPELPAGTIVTEEDRLLANMYVPINTPRREGDPGPFIGLLTAMLPNKTDRTILISYMAALLQHPGVKFQWCPMLQGCEGNGKTACVNVLANAIGWRYTHLPNATDLGGNGTKFNSWLQCKMFIGVEEIHVSDKREVLEALKPLITNPRLEIQGKGDNQITGENRANFFMCTNHKDAILKTKNDRRFAIFYTAQQSAEDIQSCGMGGGYFPKLYSWLRNSGYAIVNNYLRTYDIPAEYNPATECQRAPATSSTEEAISTSIGRVEQEILEAIAEERPGFRGGWISSMALDNLLMERRYSKISYHKRKEILEYLGYIPHPALIGGRITNLVAPEGGKPRLYVQANSIVCRNVSAADVLKYYSQAQGYSVARTPEVLHGGVPVPGGS